MGERKAGGRKVAEGVDCEIGGGRLVVVYGAGGGECAAVALAGFSWAPALSADAGREMGAGDLGSRAGEDGTAFIGSSGVLLPSELPPPRVLLVLGLSKPASLPTSPSTRSDRTGRWNFGAGAGEDCPAMKTSLSLAATVSSLGMSTLPPPPVVKPPS